MTISPEAEPIAAPTGHTFVCYARHDDGFVLGVAAAMRDRGVRIWIDQWNIEPGADWNRTIDTALKTCSSFLIVLSPEAVASDEVRAELRAALNGRKRIIPVLHRPCDIPTRLLLTQYLDFTQSPEPSVALLDHLAQALRGEDTAQDLPAAPVRDRTSRRTLLDDVTGEARDRLRSLGIDRPLPVLFEQQLHQVERSWDAEVGVPVRQRPGPPTTEIAAAFEDPSTAGQLLILGPPGSGKTTLLVQLLQQLAAAAGLDERRPVPVLISLISWKPERTLGDWLVDELKVKYGVRADLGARWRDEGRIAPLLDGLDELPAESQHACVLAINEFQRTCAPPFLVVCCRLAEYENLTVKLRLRAAVCLLPLDDDQIRSYLDQTGSAAFWTVISGEPELMEMARSPLLLSFMSALPGEAEAQRWQDAPSGAQRRERILETYLSSRASSDDHRGAYSREQTLRWLGRLATMLRKHGQAEFLIERMQPEWLERPTQRWAYRATVLVVGAAVVGLALQLVMTLFGLIPHGSVGLVLQSEFAMIYSEKGPWNRPLLILIAVVIAAVIASRQTIVPVETVTWSWSRAGNNALRWGKAAALAGLDYGTSLGLVGNVIWFLWTLDITDGTWRGTGTLVGAAGGACAVLFLALSRPSVWLRLARVPGGTRRIVEALIAAVVWMLVLGWALTWGMEWSVILVLGAAVLLSTVAVFALFGFSPASADWSRVWLLRACVIGATSAAVVGTASAFTRPVSAALGTWLSIWVSGGLVIGLMAGLLISLTLRSRAWLQSKPLVASAGVDWKRTAAAALVCGVVLALVAVALTGRSEAVRSAIGLLFFARLAFINCLALSLLAAIGSAVAAVSTAGILAMLAGLLGGATGVDIERRLVPNQGIRQSAVNIVLFSVLGVLIIGVPYGLFNLTLLAVTARTLPSPADWLRLGVGAGATFGLLAGLLPGAACIQHLVLRLILWADGSLPLRLAKFLNVATRRRLLQRVGGRYRFLHVLLRDHLDQAAQQRTPA